MRAGGRATAAAARKSSSTPTCRSNVPDATGLELIAQELGDQVVDTTYFRGQAALHVRPETIRNVLHALRAKGYTFMASLHGVDYFPEEPRLGVQYELLDMKEVDRIAVKLRVPIE